MSSRQPVRSKPAYIDRPEVPEVFSDGVERLWFDGHMLRLEFAVSRQDEDERIWAYTAARIVLSAPGAVDLMEKLSRLQAALQAQNAGPKPGTN